MSPHQTSEEKNQSFFLDHHQDYKENISKLRTYQNIFREVTDAVSGAELLVDIGNGGVFDYETSKVKHIVAVDLMFTDGFDQRTLPPNATSMLGSALDLPFPNCHADMALMNMLLHHLTGVDAESTRANLRKSISEAARILKPGGKIVVAESCVPHWFFEFEKVVLKSSARVLERVSEHPPTLQFPAALIEEMLSEQFSDVGTRRIPKGAWVLQYGKIWPSALTPVQPYLFVATKR